MILGFSEVFKALSDPTRREILLMLKNGKMTAGDIASHFEITPASVSYHLATLKKTHLIDESKYKNFVYYELNMSVFEDAMMWFAQFGRGDENEKE